MTWFINLKVSNKLLVSFGIILVCVGVLGATSAIDLGRVSSNTDEITGELMPSTAVLNKINFDAANLRIQELRAVTSDKPDEMARHLHESVQFIDDVDTSRKEYQKYISGAEERALWNAYDRHWQDYLQLHQKMIALLDDHKQSEALALIGQGGKKVFDDARDGLVEDLRFNTQRAERVTEASRAISTHARALIIGLGVAALALGLLVATVVGRAISRPLEQIIDIFGNMAAGKLDNPIETGRQDEIGVVMGSLKDMQGRLRSMIAENQGTLDAISKAQAVIEFQLDGTIITANNNFLQAVGYELEEVSGRHHSMFVEPAERDGDGYKEFWDRLRRGEYQKARFVRSAKGGRRIWIDASYNPILDADGRPFKVIKYANDVTAYVVASQQMERAVAQTQEAIRAASEGDLTVRVSTEDKAGDLRNMAQSINLLLTSMAEIVRNVKGAAVEVHRGSQELSQGNANLSQRTEEQSSSLEETASSMEEMTSTVRQSADNAGQANQLAVAARDQAEQGGQITGRAVNAMAQISESSKKISDIIGVIDEIAFQTNLLALNAAVEAARAGEEGRGFAVVANEVRALASRSAGAAKEIKDLITDSVRKVEEGSSLVTQSGRTLELIVTSVKKVSDIVAEIAAASREQSSGIEQVNKAVMQMDEMTQQNAALVEEAAAAAQAMAEQALNLNVMMDRYRVDGASASDSPQLSAASGSIDEPAATRRAERRGASRPWSKPARRAESAVPRSVAPPASRKVAVGATDSSDTEWQEF
jgi:methyl-accepting chemotaxis protein